MEIEFNINVLVNFRYYQILAFFFTNKVNKYSFHLMKS